MDTRLETHTRTHSNTCTQDLPTVLSQAGDSRLGGAALGRLLRRTRQSHLELRDTFAHLLS